jgi:two-component system sensor histidine kinase CiaH
MPNKKPFKNRFKVKRLLTIYILYWFLLAYILAALVFWFITLNSQNIQLSQYRLDMIDVDDAMHQQKQQQIADATDRNTTQYLGEGITFLILICSGAVFVFRIINRQFKQAQQQQDLIMAITHELKTPIAITKLNLETLQKRSLDNTQQQKLINTTIQEVNRLNALCNNILLTSQIEAGEYKITKEEIYFSKLVKECALDFIVRFPQRKIDMQLSNNAFTTGDLLLLKLAVNNLLDNAIKYSGKDDIVLLKLFQTDKAMRLQVIDYGQGVANEEKEKIFEKYYRGMLRQAKGTGLGLYLTKKIVQEHNGNVGITNNLPQGSIFEITLANKKN